MVLATCRPKIWKTTLGFRSDHGANPLRMRSCTTPIIHQTLLKRTHGSHKQALAQVCALCSAPSPLARPVALPHARARAGPGQNQPQPRSRYGGCRNFHGLYIYPRQTGFPSGLATDPGLVVSTNSSTAFRKGFVSGKAESRSRFTSSASVLSIKPWVRSWFGDRS